MLARLKTAARIRASVILDATWVVEPMRARARAVAGAASATLTEICCTAPDELSDRRINERLARGDDPSDVQRSRSPARCEKLPIRGHRQPSSIRPAHSNEPARSPSAQSSGHTTIFGRLSKSPLVRQCRPGPVFTVAIRRRL